MLAGLPRPRQLLVVGGPTLFWKIDEHRLLRTLSGMLEEAASEGGSVLVTISPRTPPRVKSQLARALETRECPSMLAVPGKAPRYSALLEAADSIRITADSVAMISDAIWAHKPLGIVPATKSTPGRMIIAISDQFRPGRRLYPQDLRFFWRALAEVGINERIGNPRISTDQLMQSVLDRIRPLLNRSIDGKNGERGKD
jgi:mitochondrial fission protein ELM1